MLGVDGRLWGDPQGLREGRKRAFSLLGYRKLHVAVWGAERVDIMSPVLDT